MRDKGTIIGGLFIFLVLVTFPIWYALGAAGDSSPPDLELPKDESACVEDTPYMTAHHMDLLEQWRGEVVREGKKEYTSSSGKTYVMSLTGTCMQCHSNRKTFCTECHNYADVEPGCWDCHTEPKGD